MWCAKNTRLLIAPTMSDSSGLLKNFRLVYCLLYSGGFPKLILNLHQAESTSGLYHIALVELGTWGTDAKVLVLMLPAVFEHSPLFLTKKSHISCQYPVNNNKLVIKLYVKKNEILNLIDLTTRIECEQRYGFLEEGKEPCCSGLEK